jgi:hypothetical protein
MAIEIASPPAMKWWPGGCPEAYDTARNDVGEATPFIVAIPEEAGVSLLVLQRFTVRCAKAHRRLLCGYL